MKFKLKSKLVAVLLLAGLCATRETKAIKPIIDADPLASMVGLVFVTGASIASPLTVSIPIAIGTGACISFIERKKGFKQFLKNSVGLSVLFCVPALGVAATKTALAACGKFVLSYAATAKK